MFSSFVRIGGANVRRSDYAAVMPPGSGAPRPRSGCGRSHGRCGRRGSRRPGTRAPGSSGDGVSRRPSTARGAVVACRCRRWRRGRRCTPRRRGPGGGTRRRGRRSRRRWSPSPATMSATASSRRARSRPPRTTSSPNPSRTGPISAATDSASRAKSAAALQYVSAVGMGTPRVGRWCRPGGRVRGGTEISGPRRPPSPTGRATGATGRVASAGMWRTTERRWRMPSFVGIDPVLARALVADWRAVAERVAEAGARAASLAHRVALPALRRRPKPTRSSPPRRCWPGGPTTSPSGWPAATGAGWRPSWPSRRRRRGRRSSPPGARRPAPGPSATSTSGATPAAAWSWPTSSSPTRAACCWPATTAPTPTRSSGR